MQAEALFWMYCTQEQPKIVKPPELIKIYCFYYKDLQENNFLVTQSLYYIDQPFGLGGENMLNRSVLKN
jgi:hypothetical protein